MSQQATLPAIERKVNKCILVGCDNLQKYLVKGMCSRHYNSMRNHGTPHGAKRIYGNHVKRFWQKVTKTDTCWFWNGTQDGKGYGTFSINQRFIAPHRYAYELLIGKIPEGLVIDHLCRTPLCVNPSHLEPVTQRENVMRGNAIPALNSRKVRCPKGHEYSYYKSHRYCKECRQEWHKIHRQSQVLQSLHS